MSNNLSYDEALHKLKLLEMRQRLLKKSLKKHSRLVGYNKKVSYYKLVSNKQTMEINYLLSIIMAHKQARRLYAENLILQKRLAESGR